MVTVDIGGRAYSVIEVSFSREKIGELCADLVRHFLVTFATEARINLHASIPCGVNNHHKAEALFKALGRALDAATYPWWMDSTGKAESPKQDLALVHRGV
ncbi:MAG: hypothetical protein U9R04_03260 [Chloroflexota bacterium]|nr:hypothetical protein [Chloroflexota bacterium]